MFHTMLRFGPKLEREQILLGRFVGVGAELFAIAASCSRAQYFINEGKNRDDVMSLVEHFCRESRRRIREFFRGIRHNNDRVGYELAQSVLGDAANWMTLESVGERHVEAAKPEGREAVAS